MQNKARIKLTTFKQIKFFLFCSKISAKHQSLPGSTAVETSLGTTLSLKATGRALLKTKAGWGASRRQGLPLLLSPRGIDFSRSVKEDMGN